MQSGDPATETPDRLSEAEIREAVAAANVPALLMLVFQMTGEASWLEAPYRPTRGRGLGDHDDGGLPEDVQQRIREAAVAAILDWQSGKPPAVTAPDPKLMTRMMSVFLGERVPADYGPMFAAEFARRIGDAPAPTASPTVGADLRVIIIGAGVGGIIAARELDAIGASYTILEKRAAAGGTWLQNTYPGAGVDTPSHLYSFSFAPNKWRMHFELSDELQKYMATTLADVAGDRVQYGTEVLRAVFDETQRVWRLDVRREGGALETLTADIVISCVGALNVPVLPTLPGMDGFRGQQFHSAQWPAGLDLSGKRVAVVGSGASAMQIVPAIVDTAAEVTIFQRTPQWVAPFPKFHLEIPEPLRRLLASCELYRAWYWLRLFWQFGDNVLSALERDPDWPHPERSVNARNEGHRKFFLRYMKEQLGDRSDLLEKAIPSYPPYGKRILLDNGWYRAILSPNARLITEAVAEVTPDGVITSSGAAYEADVIVWATGFSSTRFLSSLTVQGRDGRTLREAWDDDDPRAFLGIATPGFPNLLMLGGPNSFPGSGSYIFSIERQGQYVRKLLEQMLARHAATVEVTTEANDEYNRRVDEAHSKLVWTHPGMRTYYRNSRGRVVFVMPFRNIDLWRMTEVVDPEDFEWSEQAVASISTGRAE